MRTAGLTRDWTWANLAPTYTRPQKHMSELELTLEMEGASGEAPVLAQPSPGETKEKP